MHFSNCYAHFSLYINKNKNSEVVRSQKCSFQRHDEFCSLLNISHLPRTWTCKERDRSVDFKHNDRQTV